MHHSRLHRQLTDHLIHRPQPEVYRCLETLQVLVHVCKVKMTLAQADFPLIGKDAHRRTLAVSISRIQAELRHELAGHLRIRIDARNTTLGGLHHREPHVCGTSTRTWVHEIKPTEYIEV